MKLFFEIKISNGFEECLIQYAKSISKIYLPCSLSYNYTLDEITYEQKESEFESFNSFYEFFKQNNFRFNFLKLTKEIDQLYIGFQHSQGVYRIFGKIETRVTFDELILIVGNNILYGYIHNDFDMTLARVTNYDSWKRRLEGKIPEYIKLYKNPRFGSGERDEYLIDLESVPTHYHLIRTGDKLWFGACAEMYFSSIYYNYIPEEKWSGFSNCIENTVLTSGLRKIVLYKNFENYELEENRKRQWDFRKQLGIDEVAHRLIEEGRRI